MPCGPQVALDMLFAPTPPVLAAIVDALREGMPFWEQRVRVGVHVRTGVADKQPSHWVPRM